jgi:hypothetical protein
MLTSDFTGTVSFLGTVVNPWAIIAGSDVTTYTLGGKPVSCPCRWREGATMRGCKRCAGGTVWSSASLPTRIELRNRFEVAMGRVLDLINPAIEAGNRDAVYAAWALVQTMRHHIRGLGLRVSEGRMFHLLNVRRDMVKAWMLTGPSSWR